MDDRRYIYKFLIFGEKSTFAAKKKTFDKKPNYLRAVIFIQLLFLFLVV
jgi:hypothetical protein